MSVVMLRLIIDGLQCMADLANRRTLSLAKDEYCTLMNEQCGGRQAVRDIEALHEEASSQAVRTFDSTAKFGGETLARPFRAELLKVFI